MSTSSSSLEDHEFSPTVLDAPQDAPSRVVSGRRPSIGSMLGRVSTTLSAISRYNEDMYAGMSEGEIELRRTNTKHTIVDTLAARALEAGAEQDEENATDAHSQVAEIYRNQTSENALPTFNEGMEFQDIDPELVTWESEDDPMNPRNWTSRKKWFMTLITSFYTLMSPFASSIMSPSVPQISEAFDIEKQTVQLLIISIFLLGLAFGPLVTAPISEMYGRRNVLNVSIWILFFFNLGCSLSKTTAQLCVFRFLAGLVGSAPLSIGAGVLGDIFTDRERNNAIALFSLGPTVGPNVSPIISGFILSNRSLTWRWPLWVLCMFNGVVALWGTICLRETYAPQILYLKLKALRKETGNPNLHTIYEVADGETVIGKFYVNITRPLVLLASNPMVFGLGTFMALVYGCLYLLIVTFPSTWSSVYGFGVGISGLMFVSIFIGYIIGITFFTLAIERSYPKMIAKNGGVAKPEFRLPFLIVSGFTTPIGLLWYGWSVDQKVFWIMPLIGALIFAFGIIAVFQTIQNYLIDMNPRFALSSIALAAFFRSMIGFLFPLFIHQMINNLGFGWSYTLFGILGAVFGIPFPIFVIYRGEKLRLWANRKMERQQAKRDLKNLERLQKKLRKAEAKQDEKNNSTTSSNN